MVCRHCVLVLASLAVAACSRTGATDSTTTATLSGLSLAIAPIPQPKPIAAPTNVAVDPITLRPVPPLPGRKPGTERTVVVAVPEAEAEPAQIILDEDIVLSPPSSPAGQLVTVQAGDTVYALSRRYGVAVRDILQANELAPPYHLLIGQTVRLPAQRTHVVRGGETIYGISRVYGITTSELVRANELKEPYQLYVGQRLELPASDGSVPAPAIQTSEPAEVQLAVVVPAPEPVPTTFSGAGVPLPKTKPTPPVVTIAATTSPVTAADIPERTGGKFSWPVNGPLLSSYGPKDNGLHNDGINIAAPAGAPVHAAEDGVVAYVGDELAGYGNLVLLRHGDGWVTAYAHNADIRVARGQHVTRGQVIATVGTTGGVTAPQSHFEIRKGTDVVNPLTYLESL